MKYIDGAIIQEAISDKCCEFVGYLYADLSCKDRMEIFRDVFGYVLEKGTEDQQREALDLFTEALGECKHATVSGYVNPFNTYALNSVSEFVYKSFGDLISDIMYMDKQVIDESMYPPLPV